MAIRASKSKQLYFAYFNLQFADLVNAQPKWEHYLNQGGGGE